MTDVITQPNWGAQVDTSRCGAQAGITELDPTFVDQFDGVAGSPANPQNWTPDVGGTGWGNDELQYYTPSGNAFLDGAGNLVLEARVATDTHNCWYGTCLYTSSKVTTKYQFSERYGLFEARIKAPAGTGLWARSGCPASTSMKSDFPKPVKSTSWKPWATDHADIE